MEPIIYRLDKHDVIVSVGESWVSEAVAHGWDAECPPDKVVGQSLWKFIKDESIRQLYRELFRRVRSGIIIPPISLRCDSPRHRRYLNLSIYILVDGGLELRSSELRSEERAYVALLDKGVPRSGDFIKICSMCKRVEVEEKGWVEVEEAVVRLRPFENDVMPELSHGLCQDCFDVAMENLRE